MERLVTPGDQLRLEVKMLKLRPPLVICQGRTYVGDEVACEVAEMKMMITPSKQ